jgi:hypothetical protein
MKQSSNPLLTFFASNIVSLITILSGGVALALDRFGLLPPTSLPKVLLALVCLLATSEIVDKARRFDRLHDTVSRGFDDLARRLGKTALERSTSEQAHQYLTEAILRANTCVHHAAVGPGFARMLPEYKKKYYAAIEKKLRESRISYRHVTSFFDLARLTRVQRWLEDPTIHKYFVAYYPAAPAAAATIYFVIVDEEEAVVRFPRAAGEPDEYLRTAEPELVKLFLDYHRLLWQNGNKLKELHYDKAAVAQLAEDLQKSQQPA